MQVGLRFKQFLHTTRSSDSSIPQSPSFTRPTIHNFRSRFVTIISNELAELVIAICIGNMEPIIISVDCLDEVKGLTIRTDTTNIDT